MLGYAAGGAGLQLHSESSQPEPVAGVDPLTHFLSPSPAPCQGEPLVEQKKGKQERARNQRLKKGKRKGKKKEKELLKAQGPERGGGKPGMFELFEVWSGSQHIPALSFLIPPSKLPATATTHTSASARPCAKLCMTTQELSRYFRNNVHAKAATSPRWKLS